MAYTSHSPYKSAGLTRGELFNKKRKRDTSFDGVAKTVLRLRKGKKHKRTSLYFGKNEDNDWRF